MENKTQTEKAIQTKILKYLSTVPECYYFKTIATNRRGVPDIIVCYRGLFVAFEVKSSKGIASALQLYNCRKIDEANGIVRIVDCVETVKDMLNEISKLRGIKK